VSAERLHTQSIALTIVCVLQHCASRTLQPGLAAGAAAHTGVDVLAEVDGAAAAGAAGRLVQVLHAQALGLDELEQVGPLRLLDAAEQVVLRARAGAACQIMVSTGMSANGVYWYVTK